MNYHHLKRDADLRQRELRHEAAQLPEPTVEKAEIAVPRRRLLPRRWLRFRRTRPGKPVLETNS